MAWSFCGFLCPILCAIRTIQIGTDSGADLTLGAWQSNSTLLFIKLCLPAWNSRPSLHYVVSHSSQFRFWNIIPQATQHYNIVTILFWTRFAILNCVFDIQDSCRTKTSWLTFINQRVSKDHIPTLKVHNKMVLLQYSPCLFTLNTLFYLLFWFRPEKLVRRWLICKTLLRQLVLCILDISEWELNSGVIWWVIHYNLIKRNYI